MFLPTSYHPPRDGDLADKRLKVSTLRRVNYFIRIFFNSSTRFQAHIKLRVKLLSRV